MRALAVVFVIAALITLSQPALATPQLKSVEWYQVVDGNEKQVNFITPNVPYKAVLTIHSDVQTKTHIEIKADIENWFDTVIATKDAVLQPGDNRIEVEFIYHHKSWSENGESPYKGIRGTFVKVNGVYDVQSVDARFSTQAEIGLSGYYWVGLRMYVNGKEYDPDDYAPVYGGDTVRMNGYLYKSTGTPAPNFKIKWVPLIGSSSYSYTNSAGFFEKVTTAPDWKENDLCGVRARYYYIQAIDSNGDIVTDWEYDCTCMCAQPTPTPTAHFDVTDLQISPSSPKTNESVTFTATVKNTGTGSGTENVRLYINNIQHHDVKSVTLNAGQQTTLSWWYMFLYPGDYSITVETNEDSMSKTIHVAQEIPTPTPTPTPTTPTPTPAGEIEITQVAGYAVAGVAVLAVSAYYLLRR